MRKVISAILVVCFLMSCFSVVAFAETETASDVSASTVDVGAVEYVKYTDYEDYLSQHESAPLGTSEVVINASNLVSKTESVKLYDGKGDKYASDEHNFDKVIFTTGDDTVTFKFTAPEGMYNLFIEYYTEEGKDISMERELLINGKVPFDVAENLTFNRVWTDELVKDEDGNLTFTTDYYGNNIKPNQVERFEWCSSYFYDYLGYYTEPLKFYFKEGENTISLKSSKEPMTIGAIKLVPIRETQTYAEYLADCQSKGYADYSGEEVIIEAEFADSKSDKTLSPSVDVSSVSTSVKNGEMSAYKQQINMTGGTNWQYAQQSITWSVGDIEPGMYALNFKVRKNTSEGMISSRKLYINGVCPFEEGEAIGFTFSRNWKLVTIQDENEEQCLIYLEPGDTITLETTLGEMGQFINSAENALASINSIYRSVLMITGSDPDKNRDYQLDQLIPEVIEEMAVQSKVLTDIVDGIVSFTKKKGSDLASLETLARQLAEFSEDSDKIAKSLSYFKTNIGSFGTWLNTASNIPLAIDYISLSQPGSDIKKANKGFFADLGYEFNRFFSSFVVDYNAIGNMSEIDVNDKNTITVWMETGRDQFNILRNLINNRYTASTGNQVNLELVNAGALLPAIVSKIGPDVALDQAQNEPLNFALRNSVYAISNYKDTDPEYDDVISRFAAESLTPFWFDSNDDGTNELYAVPEKSSFMVLFYRKDVLSELGLSIPQTWTELISTITVLNKNNMEFAMPSTLAMYYSMLVQAGGTLFTDDDLGTNLKTDEATKSFKRWTNFFTNYDLPLTYDFQNRFRTGEMPLGIADYTLYNTLEVAAPEIRGLYGFAEIPGTERADGSIDKTNTMTTSCAVILKENINYDLSWEFLKWWTSADAQAEFGTQIECALGTSARYNTANIEAFESLPWSSSEISDLETSLYNAEGIPQIAGSYFIERHINNAFRKVKYQSKDPKDTLYDYSNTIDAEITKKRSEFGLPVREES